MSKGLSRTIAQAALLAVAVLALIAACAPAAAPVTAPQTTNTNPTAAVAAPNPTEPPAAPTAAAGEPTRGGSIRVGVRGNPTTLDPHKNTSSFDRTILYSLYDRLVDIDPNLKYIPSAADRWEVSEDGKEITFFLHPGITFSDGTPLNAEAVKFNLDRVRNPDIKSPFAPEFNTIDSIQVVDDLTVKLVLTQPSPAIFSSLAERGGLLVSPTAAQDPSVELDRNPVGSGPFTFVEWLQDDHVTLERNPNYWRPGLPYLDRVTFQVFPDENVKVTNLRSGSLDIIDSVPPKDIAAIKNNPDLTYASTTGLSTWQLVMNLTHEPFDKPEVRQALAYAIDRAAIQNGIFFGTGQVAYGMLPPSNWAYDGDVITHYTTDVDKAKTLLADAGVADGTEFSVLVINQPLRVQVVQAIQSQLEPLGLNVTVDSKEVAQYSEALRAGDYDAVLLFWAGRVDPDGTLYAWFNPAGIWDKYGYDNATVTDLIDQARNTYDLDARKPLYSEAQQGIDQDVPMVFLVHDEEAKAMSNKVENFVANPDGVIRLGDVWLNQ